MWREGGREGGREACDLTVRLTSLDLTRLDFSKCWSQKENPQSVFWPRPLFYQRLWPTGWAPSHPRIPGLLQLLSNREPDMGRGTQQRKSTGAMWLHLTFHAPQCPTFRTKLACYTDNQKEGKDSSLIHWWSSKLCLPDERDISLVHSLLFIRKRWYG